MKALKPAVLTVFLCSLFLVPSTRARAEMRLGGFTDLLFSANDDTSQTANSGFREGQFVLHVNSKLSDRASFFSEITVTPHSGEFGIEVERTIFRFNYSDALKPSIGRYHTPIGFWNSTYHHGTWLQTSIDRPLAIRFGSKFVPIHFVGMMLDGKVFPGSLTVSYTCGVGNGRAENVARAGDAGDVNNNRAVVLRTVLRSDALYELQVGGSVYFDRYFTALSSGIKERIASGFVALTSETPEVMAEYFAVHHEDVATGRRYDSTSYYVQLAYRLPVLSSRFKPYARIEETKIDDGDPGYATLVSDLKRVVGGVRFDFIATAALKLEGQRAREASGPYVNRVVVGVNLAF